MLIQEKVRQAAGLLQEFDIDCWVTFVRESGIMRDPMLDYLIRSDVTWHSAFIVSRTGEIWAIVGQMDKQAVEDLDVYTNVLGYVESIRDHLLTTLEQLKPRQIAVNYSQNSEVCDGLTHGMFLSLKEMLAGSGFAGRLVSSEKICSSLKARKTPFEIERIRTAIDHTLEIFDLAAPFIRPGRTEKEIAAFMIAEVERRGLGFGWDKSHCPAVFSGPETAEAHYMPTDRPVERGHVLNMDFGVKFEDYVSDLQRTFYILEEGETEAPPEVRKGFGTIAEAIRLAAAALEPGVQGVAIDKIARDFIVSRGYDEFPHGLGHQVGRFAHDGTALLGPPWEKYGTKPFQAVEENMVFTIEPRLKVPGRGVVTIEEMVLVTSTGAEFLSKPQTELVLVE
jgi:Xaa-Pro aminopeptidase